MAHPHDWRGSGAGYAQPTPEADPTLAWKCYWGHRVRQSQKTSGGEGMGRMARMVTLGA